MTNEPRFTGAYDRNGEKLYEGSRVYAYKPNSYLKGVYVVEWHPTRCAFHYRSTKTGEWARSRNTFYLIGNNKAGAYCELITPPEC